MVNCLNKHIMKKKLVLLLKLRMNQIQAILMYFLTSKLVKRNLKELNLNYSKNHVQKQLKILEHFVQEKKELVNQANHYIIKEIYSID